MIREDAHQPPDSYRSPDLYFRSRDFSYHGPAADNAQTEEATAGSKRLFYSGGYFMLGGTISICYRCGPMGQ
jgi:hypothetical protein